MTELLVNILTILRPWIARRRQLSQKQFDGPQHWALMSGRDGRQRGIIGLSTSGCSYGNNAWGGCAICGHSSSTLWNSTATSRSVLDDFSKSLDELSHHRPAMLCVYTSGSFFDAGELAAHAREKIVERIMTAGWIQQLNIESLPHFITPATLAPLVVALQRAGIAINVGIGMDSGNLLVRGLCSLRHVPRHYFENAVRTCRELEVTTTAYVIHQPPFLTEDEAIWDTAQSVISADEIGFSSISIEPMALQPGTLQQFLYEGGQYRPPSFASLVNAIAHLSALGRDDLFNRTVVGGQVFTPLPTWSIRRCSHCASQSRGRLTRSAAALLEHVPCGSHAPERCGDLKQVVAARALDEAELIERILAVVREDGAARASSPIHASLEK